MLLIFKSYELEEKYQLTRDGVLNFVQSKDISSVNYKNPLYFSLGFYVAISGEIEEGKLNELVRNDFKINDRIF